MNDAAPLLAYALGGDGAAGRDLGDRVRDDPRRRRRPDDHRVGVVRARRLRQRDQEGQAASPGRRSGSPACTALVIGVVAIDRRHPRQRPERRVPRGARVRGGRVGEPADDPVLAVLEAVQHHRRAVLASTAAWSSRRADHLLAGRSRARRRRSSGRAPTSRSFPLYNPGIVSIPLSFLLGIVGTLVGAEQGHAGGARGARAQGRRDGGPLDDRAPGSSNTAYVH